MTNDQLELITSDPLILHRQAPSDVPTSGRFAHHFGHQVQKLGGRNSRTAQPS